MRIVCVIPVSINRDIFTIPKCHSRKLMHSKMQAVRMTEASEESCSVKALINKLGLEGF